MDCNHVWQGVADDIVCTRCGLKLTREEWLKSLEPEKPEKPEKPKAASKPKKTKKTEK